jgi:hypothetical protein
MTTKAASTVAADIATPSRNTRPQAARRLSSRRAQSVQADDRDQQEEQRVGPQDDG